MPAPAQTGHVGVTANLRPVKGLDVFLRAAAAVAAAHPGASFHLAGEHLLLVKWKSEFCGSVYTLFSVAAALQPIAGNNYECDP